MNDEITPRIAPEVIWHTVDDNAVVVCPKVGKVRVLNGSATLIWHLLSENNSMDAIRDHLVTTYEVTAAQANHDLSSFVKDLSERGLLIW